MTLERLLTKEVPSCVIARHIVNLWLLDAHMSYCLECTKWLNEQEKKYGKIVMEDKSEKANCVEVIDNCES